MCGIHRYKTTSRIFSTCTNDDGRMPQVLGQALLPTSLLYLPRFWNSRRGIISCVILFLASQSGFSATTLPDSCVSTHFDEKLSISYVIDGDTIVLEDKRHVRLIGINTPELGNKNKAAEPGAVLAHNALRNILSGHSNINIRYDTERFDRHGRTLAHLYLGDGTNIQALMLNQGMAIPITIPPNTLHFDCYSDVAKTAKTDEKGLWALPRFQAKAVSSLHGTERGFYFINGSVAKITESRSALWINLKNNVALRIVKDDLNYFNNDALKSLSGKHIEAKGWLYKKKGQLRMRIRHPSDISLVREK